MEENRRQIIKEIQKKYPDLEPDIFNMLTNLVGTSMVDSRYLIEDLNDVQETIIFLQRLDPSLVND